MLRSSEPWIEHHPRRARAVPAAQPRRGRPPRRTLERWHPWSCCSSATRCRCASTRAPSTAPPIRRSRRLGLTQAAALAEWLAEEEIDAIWCSPMRRARETAAPALGAARARRHRRRGHRRVRPRVAQLHPRRGAQGGQRPALVPGARATRALPGGGGGGRRAHRGRPPAPARRGGVPRRRDQRLRRPRARHRRPAVLPPRLHVDQPRAGGVERRAQHRQPQRDRPPPQPLRRRRTTRARARSPRTEPSSVPMV